MKCGCGQYGCFENFASAGYINEKPLILISTDEVDLFTKTQNILLTRYANKTKFLLNYIDMMEKGMKYEAVVLYFEDKEKIYKDLKTIAPPIKAAGGIVFNNKGELLVIFRKGFWDLAKGHLHQNEKKRDAAVREVIEETGLLEVKVNKKAGKTFHLYKNKYRHLKISHWYYMNGNQDILNPQLEEEILEAKWVNPDHFLKTYNMYASIKDLLERSIKKK